MLQDIVIIHTKFSSSDAASTWPSRFLMSMDIDKDIALFVDVTGSNSELAVQHLQLADFDVMVAMER